MSKKVTASRASPCPWCGSAEHLVYENCDGDIEWAHVRCTECGAEGPQDPDAVHDAVAELALRRWNERAA